MSRASGCAVLLFDASEMASWVAAGPALQLDTASKQNNRQKLDSLEHARSHDHQQQEQASASDSSSDANSNLMMSMRAKELMTDALGAAPGH